MAVDDLCISARFGSDLDESRWEARAKGATGLDAKLGFTRRGFRQVPSVSRRISSEAAWTSRDGKPRRECALRGEDAGGSRRGQRLG
jgi:hypothetical protein